MTLTSANHAIGDGDGDGDGDGHCDNDDGANDEGSCFASVTVAK